MQKSARKTARPSSTVLVVDHDNAERARVRRLLESSGFRVLDAGDVAAAEQIAQVFVGPIRLLLLDVNIVGIGAGELANRLRSLRPELRVLFMSERSQRDLVKQGRLGSREPFIRKPPVRTRLALKIRALLDLSSSAK